MARYRTIDVRVWSDEKFCQLSAPAPNAQTLWFYLLTGEHTGPLPGLSRVGELALAEALGWTIDDFRRCWAEIAERQMAVADWQARVVWVPRRIEYAEPGNPNVVKSWRAAWDEMPECALKAEAGRVYDAHMAARDLEARERAQEKGKEPPRQLFSETFRKACPPADGKDSRKGFRNGSGNDCRNGMANQEQEQEQEQDLLPPTPLGEGGGRSVSLRPPTRAERKRAEELRSRVYGGCPHTPKCATFQACIEDLVYAARQQKAAAPARAAPEFAEVG